MTFESATDRLDRLLTMVPWLMRNQGIDIAEAAQTFGVSSEQIVDDLQLLFVCGTPGHLPDDLIEASWEGGKVYVGNAETISHPLRLGRDEALALIVALRALAASPGLGDSDAISRALAKLETAAGESVSAAGSVSVSIDSDDQQQAMLAQIRSALGTHSRLHLRYLVASRDEATERDVDPMRVLNVDGRWYVEAWCHRARDVRLFRLDRIETLQVLTIDGTPPEFAVPRPVGPGVFQPREGDALITLEVSASAAWVAEQFPVDSVEPAPDGGLVVQLRAADPRWVVRLVWRLGGAIRIISPAYVADMVRSGARSAVQMNPSPRA